jgi:uncharacterized protein YjiK
MGIVNILFQKIRYSAYFFIFFTVYAQNSPLDFYHTNNSLYYFDEIEDGEISGVTWDSEDNKFFFINDEDGIIWETDSVFNILRIITGANFGDTEDIIFLPENKFGILTEAGKLFIGFIENGEDNFELNQNSFQEITFMNHQGNSGPEGIAFDEVNGLFYVAKEKNPMVIYHFSLSSIYGDTSIIPEISFDAELVLSDEIDDISALLFDQRTQRLLVLSEESDKILDVDPSSGEIISQLYLMEDYQYEGMSFYNQFYNILVAGEPNFYVKILRPCEASYINSNFNVQCLINYVLSLTGTCDLDLNFDDEYNIFDVLISTDIQNGFNFYRCTH